MGLSPRVLDMRRQVCIFPHQKFVPAPPEHCLAYYVLCVQTLSELRLGQASALMALCNADCYPSLLLRHPLGRCQQHLIPQATEAELVRRSLGSQSQTETHNLRA